MPFFSETKVGCGENKWMAWLEAKREFQEARGSKYIIFWHTAGPSGGGYWDFTIYGWREYELYQGTSIPLLFYILEIGGLALMLGGIVAFFTSLWFLGLPSLLIGYFCWRFLANDFA